MRRSTCQRQKKRVFSEKGGRQFSEWGVWQGFVQERQFSEEVQAIQWTAGLWKAKSWCPHPLPENQLWFKVIFNLWGYFKPCESPTPFWQLTRTMVWVVLGRKFGPCCLSFLFSTGLQYFWFLAVQILCGLSFGLIFLILWGWGWFPHRQVRLFLKNRLKRFFGILSWRVPNPPGANPLVAERAFPTSDYWGRTGVAGCAEEMTQESLGISNRVPTPLSQKTAKTSKGPFQLPGG